MLLNQLTDTDLRAHQVGTWTASGNTVAYTLRLVSSAATAVSSIAVYETVVNLAASTLVSNQFIGRDINLAASSTLRHRPDDHRRAPSDAGPHRRAGGRRRPGRAAEDRNAPLPGQHVKEDS